MKVTLIVHLAILGCPLKTLIVVIIAITIFLSLLLKIYLGYCPFSCTDYRLLMAGGQEPHCNIIIRIIMLIMILSMILILIIVHLAILG